MASFARSILPGTTSTAGAGRIAMMYLDHRADRGCPARALEITTLDDDGIMTEPTHSWAVDSLEEGIAAVEDDGGRMLQVPAWLLPEGVREGMVLSVTVEQHGDTSVVKVRLDREATERALARSREQLRGPTGNDPGGDIVL